MNSIIQSHKSQDGINLQVDNDDDGSESLYVAS